MMRSRFFARLLPCLVALAVAAPAAAQDAVDMAAAKREGKVSWYTSTPIEAAQKIAKLFEEETGIKVQLFRSGGSAILRRFMQEYEAKRVAADVLTTSDPAASASLARKGVFVPFKPVNFDKIPAEAKDAEGRLSPSASTCSSIFVRGDKVPRRTARRPGATSPTRNTRARW